jgi:hypothetical protein
MTQKLKPLKIIHIALCIGLSLAYILIGNLTDLDNLSFPDIETDSLIYLAIPVVALFLSNFLYKNKVKEMNTKESLDKNISTYQTACILRWAIVEGAAFVLLFLKPDFVIFGILLVIYLITLYPSQDRMEFEMKSRA